MAGSSLSHGGTENNIQIDSRASPSEFCSVWCARADSGKSVASEVRGERLPRRRAVDVSIGSYGVDDLDQNPDNGHLLTVIL